ncbi:MAG: hypothetical protein K6E18_01705 [Lachnospiraceae bacterium]|nr:hypothetical protein [Lachnospiraceae bacterium]
MMKKQYLAAAMVSLMMAMPLSGCAGQTASESAATEESEPETINGEASFGPVEDTEKEEAPVEEAETEEAPQIEEDPAEAPPEEAEQDVQDQIVGLPVYKSPESGSIEEAITLWLWKEMGFETPNHEGGVNIPAYVIVKTETTEDDFTKVYGDFWVYEYSLDGTNFVCESGGSYPGVFYLRQNENGYEASSFEMAEDGSGYMESVEAICGDNEELKKAFLESTDASNPKCINARIGFIRWYANANGLKIDTYQDFGWDPVSLAETVPEPEEAPEEAGEE